MTVVLPLLVAIVGLIFYGFASGKANEVGRIMFWSGLIVFLLHFGPDTVTLFKGGHG